MKAEHCARFIIAALLVALPLVVLGTPWGPLGGTAPAGTIEMHARMADTGGWTPGDLTARAGQPLHLRLTSDDVMHGFAIGQSDRAPVDVKPGQSTDITLEFDRPGEYTFYCTRWCGPNHWRMRGTITVEGPGPASTPAAAPLYTQLHIDPDAPHDADVLPAGVPSAARGAALGVPLPPQYAAQAYYRTHSPAQTWHDLRADAAAQGLSDAQVWDLVALAWQANATPQELEAGAQLYAANCAACHGARGAGDGPEGALQAQSTAADAAGAMGQAIVTPANFTDRLRMLGASPALLQGKIMRGGMGTGMPYWGPILTDEQTWALVAYLRTFQFEAK